MSRCYHLFTMFSVLLLSSCDDRVEIDFHFDEIYVLPWVTKSSIEFQKTEFFEFYTPSRVERLSVSERFLLSKTDQDRYFYEIEVSEVDEDFLLNVEVFTQTWYKSGQTTPYLEVEYNKFKGITFSLNDEASHIHERFGMEKTHIDDFEKQSFQNRNGVSIEFNHVHGVLEVSGSSFKLNQVVE